MSLSLTRGMNLAGIGHELGPPMQSTVNLPSGITHGSALAYPDMFNPNNGKERNEVASLVWKLGIIEGGSFLTDDILPKRKVDALSIQWEETHMPPTFLDQSPEWAQDKLVEIKKQYRVTRMNRSGIAINIEARAAGTTFGEQALYEYAALVANATANTLGAQALRGLTEAAHNQSLRTLKMNHLRGRTAWECLQPEVTLYGFLQKLKNPFKAIDVQVTTEMGRTQGRHDTYILPYQARGYTETSPQFTDYMKAGPAGPALLSSDFQSPVSRNTYPGMGDNKVFTIPLEYYRREITSVDDIMSHISQVGEYYVIDNTVPWDSEKWSPEHQAIDIYDQERDDWAHIHLYDVVERSGLFDENGNLQPIDKLKWDAPDGVSKEDMFTTASGLPAKIFGDIPSVYLSAHQRKQWARAALNQMNRNRLGNEGIELQISKILVKIQNEANGADPVESTNLPVNDLVNLMNEFERIFGSSVYLDTKQPVQNKLELFADNILMPQFLPAFTGSKGMNAPDDLNVPYNGFMAELFKSWTKGTVTDLEIESGLKIYALRIIFGEGQYPKENSTDTGNNAKSIEKAYEDAVRTKSGNQLMRIYQSAKDTYEKLISTASGSTDTKWDVEPRYKFSPYQVKVVYEKLKKNIAGAKKLYEGITLMPGDPDFPGIPATYERLKELFDAPQLHSSLVVRPIGSHFVQHTPLVKELAHQAIQSKNMAEEHRYSEHITPHAYLSSNASSGLRSLLSNMESIGAPIHPSKFDSTKFDNELLVSLTSEEFGNQMDELYRIASPAERIVATLFNTCRITLDTLKAFASARFPLPFAGMLFRPDITHIAGGGLAVQSGGGAGYMAVGAPLWVNGSDADHQSFSAHLTIYSAAVINNPNNVYGIPAAMLLSYEGGNSDKWIDLSEDKLMSNNRDRYESLYGLIIPATHARRIPSVVSITGNVLHDKFLAEVGAKDEQPFPQASRFVRTTGTYRRYKDEPQTAENGGTVRNIICLQGGWRFMDIDNRTAIKRGQGHLGITSRPGAKGVRSNATLQYPSEDGLNFA